LIARKRSESPRSHMGETPSQAGYQLPPVPPPAPTYLRRERLHRLVHGLLQAPNVLIKAPAGSGKSALVSACLIEFSGPVGWFALADGGSDADAAVEEVVATLEGFAFGSAWANGYAGARTGPVQRRAQVADGPPPDSGPAVFVLDNVEVILRSLPAADMLDRLVTTHPRWLHLVLISRRMPTRVAVDQLRARGDLVELPARALLFTHAEARQLLRQAVPDLPTRVRRCLAAQASG
jgi:LuxR family maltose regulon positive regulatory protein